LQSAYDPYRIISVLKRKPGTKRGEGQGVTIPFDQAIDEVVNGGDLFGEGPVEGLKSIRALTDTELAAEMAAEVAAFWNEKDAEKKKVRVEEFKAKHADHLDVLIDPEHPDLGPNNNQFMFVWGRMKGGREDVVHRFFQEAYGTINMNGHTTVCQGSLYFTGKAVSANWQPPGRQAFNQYCRSAPSGHSFTLRCGAGMAQLSHHILRIMAGAKSSAPAHSAQLPYASGE
jgi:anaerobic selenocysteine-containing dehydrogenase